jgi:tetratricopeptide (TPR) repeat protein
VFSIISNEYYAKADYPIALDYYNQAIKTDPSKADYPIALDYYNQAIKTDPLDYILLLLV